MTTWIVVLLVAAGSYAYRVVPLFAGSRMNPDGRIARAATTAGLAAVAAVVASGLRPFFIARPGAGLGAALAVVVAVLMTWRGRGLLAAVGAALAVDLVVTLVA